MTLVDTSVWIDHFRRSNPSLSSLLEEGHVLTHPFVIGELACGALRNRRQILTDLSELPEANRATHSDLLQLVERRRLWGKGISWIDCHLLGAAILSDCSLWTLDAALQRVIGELGLTARP